MTSHRPEVRERVELGSTRRRRRACAAAMCGPSAAPGPRISAFAQVKAQVRSELRHLVPTRALTCGRGITHPPQSAGSPQEHPHEPPSPHRWRLVCSGESRATGAGGCPPSSWRSRAAGAPGRPLGGCGGGPRMRRRPGTPQDWSASSTAWPSVSRTRSSWDASRSPLECRRSRLALRRSGQSLP